MRVLIVCSGNANNFNLEKDQSFVFDQVKAVKSLNSNIEFDYLFIKGKGLFGYLSNISKLREKIKEGKFDLIHAHYSYSGLISNIQMKTPVITTYHGSDINNRINRFISLLVCWRSKANVFVNKKLYDKVSPFIGKNYKIIPCGVDLNIFNQKNKEQERKKLGYSNNIKYILFSSSFDNEVKNFKLLDKALKSLNRKDIEVIELKNYTRIQVSEIMNAVDLCVMTSFNEGSPQFIKEAMACNCPIISTNVGDVEFNLSEVQNCHIIGFNSDELGNKITEELSTRQKTNGREKLLKLNLDSETISKEILEVYKKVGKK